MVGQRFLHVVEAENGPDATDFIILYWCGVSLLPIPVKGMEEEPLLISNCRHESATSIQGRIRCPKEAVSCQLRETSCLGSEKNSGLVSLYHQQCGIMPGVIARIRHVRARLLWAMAILQAAFIWANITYVRTGDEPASLPCSLDSDRFQNAGSPVAGWSNRQ